MVLIRPTTTFKSPVRKAQRDSTEKKLMVAFYWGSLLKPANILYWIPHHMSLWYSSADTDCPLLPFLKDSGTSHYLSIIKRFTHPGHTDFFKIICWQGNNLFSRHPDDAPGRLLCSFIFSGACSAPHQQWFGDPVCSVRETAPWVTCLRRALIQMHERWEGWWRKTKRDQRGEWVP